MIKAKESKENNYFVKNINTKIIPTTINFNTKSFVHIFFILFY